MAEKTAELLMGADNPNRPEELTVRMEEIKQLKEDRDELQSENAELRCASRQLNMRLVSQAMVIDTEQRRREDLETLVRRARIVIKISHLKIFKTHRKYFTPLTMATPECPVCMVLVETERSVS